MDWRYTASGPSPALKVEAARELGFVAQSADINGRDGAVSARLWGQEVWAFGDTFLAAPNAQGLSLLSNTFAYSASGVDGSLTLIDGLDDAACALGSVALAQVADRAAWS